jgi:hypothetical protein
MRPADDGAVPRAAASSPPADVPGRTLPEETMDLSALLRPLTLLALPATLVAFGLMAAAAATAGDSVESSPPAIASTAAALIAVLAVGALALAALGRLREAGRSVAGPAIALVGTVLVAGGEWASLFVLPALSSAAPHLLSSGALAAVPVGFVASYAVFAVGWVATAVALARAGIVPVWLGVLLALGAVAGLVPAPEPARLLIVSIAVLLVGRRLGIRTEERSGVGQITADI